MGDYTDRYDLTTSYDTTRTYAVATAEEAEQRRRTRAAARRNLAAYALERDDPESWLGDMLDALGLKGDTE